MKYQREKPPQGTFNNSAFSTPAHENLVFPKSTEMDPHESFDPSEGPDAIMHMQNTSTTVITDNIFQERVDIVIACVSIFLVIIGLFGNAASFLYFTRKTLSARSLPSHVYAVITGCDASIALVALPVIVSLFSSRQKKFIFDEDVQCGIWAVVFYFLKRISIFLVMVVSLTRTVRTVRPLSESIENWHVLIAVVIYGLVIALVDAIFLATGWLKTSYREKESMCEIFPNIVKADSTHSKIYSIALQIELLAPVFIVLASFLTCTVSLAKQQREFRGIRLRRFRRVTITIAMFTGIFLVCNIPAFAVQLNYLMSAHFKKSKEVKQHSQGLFIGWYLHLLSHFFLTLLNAAVNPCLYLSRMPGYRRWLSRQRDRRRSLAAIRSSSFSTSFISFASMLYRRLSNFSSQDVARNQVNQDQQCFEVTEYQRADICVI
jgi:hypothetical protein